MLLAAGRSLQPSCDSWHITGFDMVQDPLHLNVRGFKEDNMYLKVFMGGVKHPLYWPLYDKSCGAIAEECKREGADGVDLKSNLKIFTIFNSHPLCRLSHIFYCKVNCLPNGHCEDLGSRNNLSRNWCSCSSAGTRVLCIYKKHS